MQKKNKIAFGKPNLLRNDQLNNKKIKIGFVEGQTHLLGIRID